MKQVIIFPRGQLSPEDRCRLRDSGFLAVEADTPRQVVCAVHGAPLDLFMAALHGARHAYAICRSLGLGRVAALYRAARYLLTGRTGKYRAPWNRGLW